MARKHRRATQNAPKARTLIQIQGEYLLPGVIRIGAGEYVPAPAQLVGLVREGTEVVVLIKVAGTAEDTDEATADR